MTYRSDEDNMNVGKKLPVRLTKAWIIEIINLIEACYDLEWEGNKDAVELLKYLDKRQGDFKK